MKRGGAGQINGVLNGIDSKFGSLRGLDLITRPRFASPLRRRVLCHNSQSQMHFQAVIRERSVFSVDWLLCRRLPSI